jgi:hypothetical protein
MSTTHIGGMDPAARQEVADKIKAHDEGVQLGTKRSGMTEAQASAYRLALNEISNLADRLAQTRSGHPVSDEEWDARIRRATAPLTKSMHDVIAEGAREMRAAFERDGNRGPMSAWSSSRIPVQAQDASQSKP